MGEKSSIEWCHDTFNAWLGCRKKAPGCKNCYAESYWNRFGIIGRTKTSPANWRKPFSWDRAAQVAGERRRVFCSSLADVCEQWGGQPNHHWGPEYKLWRNKLNDRLLQDEKNPGPDVYRACTLDDLRVDLFRLIDSTPWLDWLLLTKRPENIPRMWTLPVGATYIPEAGAMNDNTMYRRENTWLGTSISDQATADTEIGKLLQCRHLAPVLFLSVEPLLERVNLQLDGIDWVIVGGESGGGCRPCELGWIVDVVEQCQAAGVPCFVKQLGGHAILDVRFDRRSPGWSRRLGHPKGGDMSEWPDAVCVREFPKVVTGV